MYTITHAAGGAMPSRDTRNQFLPRSVCPKTRLDLSLLCYTTIRGRSSRKTEREASVFAGGSREKKTEECRSTSFRKSAPRLTHSIEEEWTEKTQHFSIWSTAYFGRQTER